MPPSQGATGEAIGNKAAIPAWKKVGQWAHTVALLHTKRDSSMTADVISCIAAI